jgi:hypothetical protein
MIFLSIFILTYLGGYLVFTSANFIFDIYHEWDTAYYIWASFSHGGAFAWAALYFREKSKVIRRYILPVGVLGVAISIWEIIAVSAAIPVNDQWATLATFWIVLGVFIYYLRHLIINQK